MISLLILFFSLHLTVQSHTIYLQLIEYGHPSNMLWSGKQCDTDGRPCDPRFHICLKTRLAESTCNYIQNSTSAGHFRDKAHIVFGSKIGEMENLFRASVPASQPITIEPYLVVRVVNDSEKNRPMVSFASKLNEAREYYINGSNFESSYLKVRYWYTCSNDWYGPTCNTRCIPTRNNGSHYGCNMKTGDWMCEKGYKKASTGKMFCEKDPCFLNPPCKFSTECLVIPPNEVDSRSYRCNCSKHLQGPHCEDVKSPCGKEICLNGGKCWIDERNVSRCQCPPQFTGDLCEKLTFNDVKSINNQCNTRNQSNPWCFNNGKCIPRPLVGDKTCFCPKQFGGERCELNVTWVSAYNELTLWDDLTRKYFDTFIESRRVKKKLNDQGNQSLNPSPSDFVNSRDISDDSKYLDFGSQASHNSMLTNEKIHDKNIQRLVQGLSAKHDVVNQAGIFSIKTLHFGLIVTALACLAGIVLGLGLVFFCRRRAKRSLPDYLRNEPPGLRESCRPVIYTPCTSTIVTSLNTSTIPYMWNPDDEYRYIAPGTEYECLDHI